MISTVIRSIGEYLPEKRMENAEFEQFLDTSDEWIKARTGIACRHIAAKDEYSSDLGAKAGLQALQKGGFSPDDIDLVVVATTTPDQTMPATAAHVQRKLGIKNAGAFDVNAACAGFVYALAATDGLLKTGVAKRALLIGAETYSRILDWKDRGTSILFGDGAGAIVIEAVEQPESEEKRGILCSSLDADGSLHEILNTTGGVSTTQTAGVLTMSGKEVFRNAVSKMSESVLLTLEKCKLRLEDLDLLVPHQANIRILQSVAQKLGLKDEQVVVTVEGHANTSAASIPLALARAEAENKLTPGKIVAICALGAGLGWGSCIIRW